jgi:hypothetical protein
MASMRSAYPSGAASFRGQPGATLKERDLI